MFNGATFQYMPSLNFYGNGRCRYHVFTASAFMICHILAVESDTLVSPYGQNLLSTIVSTLAGSFSSSPISCDVNNIYDGLGHITCSVPVSQALNPVLGDQDGNLDIAVPRPWPSEGYLEFSCAPTKMAIFEVPRSIAIMPDGNTVLVADENAIRTMKLDTSSLSTIAGRMGCCCYNDSTFFSRFTALLSVAPSLDGVYAYATDAGTEQPLIRVNVQSGAVERRLRGQQIAGIAEYASGMLVFANAGQNRIETYNWATGVRRVLAGSSDNATGLLDGEGAAARFDLPFSLAVSPDGSTVYVVDQPSRAVIRRVDMATGATTCWVGTSDTAGKACRFPSGSSFFHDLAVSPDGDAVIAVDVNNSQLLSFRDAENTIEVIAGSRQVGYADGLATAALFDQPAGLSLTADGALLVVSEVVQPGGAEQFPRLRAVARCSAEACPWGQWRGPCNAAYRGRCANCSLPPHAHYTAASNPYDRDACPWVCDDVSGRRPAGPPATRSASTAGRERWPHCLRRPFRTPNRPSVRLQRRVSVRRRRRRRRAILARYRRSSLGRLEAFWANAAVCSRD